MVRCERATVKLDENTFNTDNWHTGTKSWTSYEASLVESEKLKGKERLIPAGSTCLRLGGAVITFPFSLRNRESRD